MKPNFQLPQRTIHLTPTSFHTFEHSDALPMLKETVIVLRKEDFLAGLPKLPSLRPCTHRCHLARSSRKVHRSPAMNIPYRSESCSQMRMLGYRCGKREPEACSVLTLALWRMCATRHLRRDCRGFYRRNQFGNEPQFVQQGDRSKILSNRLRVLVVPERHCNQTRP